MIIAQSCTQWPPVLHGHGASVLALHAGEVVYGNIGTADRHDFTVIGPAVNLAFQLETLTKELGRAPLLSAEFAKLCSAAVEPLGAHSLRGLSTPVEVFAPAAP